MKHLRLFTEGFKKEDYYIQMPTDFAFNDIEGVVEDMVKKD